MKVRSDVSEWLVENVHFEVFALSLIRATPNCLGLYGLPVMDFPFWWYAKNWKICFPDGRPFCHTFHDIQVRFCRLQTENTTSFFVHYIMPPLSSLSLKMSQWQSQKPNFCHLTNFHTATHFVRFLILCNRCQQSHTQIITHHFGKFLCRKMLRTNLFVANYNLPFISFCRAFFHFRASKSSRIIYHWWNERARARVRHQSNCVSSPKLARK